MLPGNKAPVYMIPGNHDVTNAIGFYKPMYPAKDAGSMAGILQPYD
jgi:DNA repair exonuclease SbcCD nuclease subunit